MFNNEHTNKLRKELPLEKDKNKRTAKMINIIKIGNSILLYFDHDL